MPRVTRKSLAEETVSRSRSRTPAKTSKAPAKSPSPAVVKPAGTKGKGTEKVVESQRRGRSASRKKAGAATGSSPATAAQTATSESRSRSRSAVSKEKARTPAKRAHEKVAKEESEEVKPKRARSRAQSEGKPAETTQRKGRSPAKAAVTPKNKAKSPAQAVAPASRVAKSHARKARSPAKAPASAKGKEKTPAKASTPARKPSKSPAKAAASTSSSRSPRTPAAKTANKKKEEPKKSTPRSRSAATPPSKGSKSPRSSAKPEKKKAEAKKASPRGRGKNAASTPKTHSGRSKEAVQQPEGTEQNAEEKETVEVETELKDDAKDNTTKSFDSDVEMKEDSGDAETLESKKDDGIRMSSEQDDSKDRDGIVNDKCEEEVSQENDAQENKESSRTAETTAAPVEAESKPAEDAVVDDVEEKAQLSTSENVEEPKDNGTQAANSSDDSLETAAISLIPEPEQDKNGETDSVVSPPRSPVKRKLEKVSETVETESTAKKARQNGNESEEDMEVKGPEASGTEGEPSRSDLLKDFVVVNIDDVPSPDSAEVAASVPAEKEEVMPAVEEPMETEKKAECSSSEPVFVVPLTQVEMIKACAYADRKEVTEYGEGDDASSTAVEVGSLGGSEIMSRHLDVSETLSARNSTDGDPAADVNIDEFDIDSNKNTSCAKASESVPSADETSSAKSSSNQDDPGSISGPDDPVPASSVIDIDSAPANPVPAVSEPVADPSVDGSDAKDVQSVIQSDPSTAAQNSSVLQPCVPVSVETVDLSAQGQEPATHNSGPSTTPNPSTVTASLGTPDPVSSCSSSGILNRAYVPVETAPTGSVTPDKCFSLVSYNILAECNRMKADYSYTAEEFLCQEYRHGLLMKELQYLDGDVVCLQEVNPDYFNNTLLPAMRSLGYDGLMMRRTKEAFDEGEATFFKTSVFEMETSKRVSLSEVAFQEVEKAGVSDEVGVALKKYLDRADVVLITKLRCKMNSKVVTIGNVHVVWDFSRCPDVQCIQIACAIKEVVSMSGSEGAHIICGDFNSECTTPAYQMVVDGSISESSVSALQSVNNLELENGAKSLVSHLRQAFQYTSTPLRSVYSTVMKNEPEITSLTSFMEGAVDYQFYSANSLAPVGVWKTVDRAVIKASGGLPTRDFPSDHVSMKSVMTFCN